MPGTAKPATAAGSRSHERAAAVLGDGGGARVERHGPEAAGQRVDHQSVAAVASESACAKARVCRTVSGPSPASLTRSDRSSAVEEPV